MGWIETSPRRGVREREVDTRVPQELDLELVEHRDLLARWVRGDAAMRRDAAALRC